jgi:hypothetical protein
MTSPTQLLGIDISLFGGDFEVTSSGDLQVIVSYENVGQAINNRLLTEQGSLAYDIFYGTRWDLVIGSKNLTSSTSFIEAVVRESLSKEPRIDSVISVQVYPTKDVFDGYNIKVVVSIIDQVFAMNLIYPNYKTSPVVNSIISEEQISFSRMGVNAEYDIYQVLGVYEAIDEDKLGTNYFTNGNFNRKTITLGALLPQNATSVIIDYTTLSTVRTARKVEYIYGEVLRATDAVTVIVSQDVYNIYGVHLRNDSNRSGTNYFKNGIELGTISGTRTVNLAQYLPNYNEEVVVDYYAFK